MAAGIEKDFTVYPYSKTIRHNSSATEVTVHTVQEFYSWLMDLFDEPAYMSFEKPMKYNTPTSYTMLNGWFIDNGDGSEALKYLSGGSIATEGYGDGSADEILMIDLDATTDFIASDKDKTIRHSSTTTIGPLLAYKNDYPASTYGRIWVRNTAEVTAPTDGVAIDILPAESGTGAGTIDEDVSSGNEIYTNLYTIASFPGTPNPQVYIRQLHPVNTANNPATDVRIAEWSTLSHFDPGSIDVLIPVQLGGNVIDSGLVNVHVRQTGDTFTHVADVDLSAGSRTPVATETAGDTVNVTEGEYYLLVDGATAFSTDFSVGDIIMDVDNTQSTAPGWYAEVVTVTQYTASTGLLILRNLNGTITDNDNIYVDGTIEGVANGTPGDTLLSHTGAGTLPDGTNDMGLPLEGGTSGAHRILRGYDNTQNVMVLQVYHTHGTTDSQDYTGSGRDALYIDFSSGEVVDAPTSGTSDVSVTTNAVSTTLISGFSDITVAHYNGFVTVSSLGSFSYGEVIESTNPTATYIYLGDNGTNTMYLGNVDSGNEPTATSVFTGAVSAATANCDSTMTDANTLNKEFPLQSTGALYSAFIEGGDLYNTGTGGTGRSFTDIYAYLQYRCGDGAAGASAIDSRDDMYTSNGSAITVVNGQFYLTSHEGTYTANKSAPFGNLAGGVFFGSQGVWVAGMNDSDDNNVKLTDSTGSLQEPDTAITVSVTNTRQDDTVYVFESQGSGSLLVKKNQYTCIAGELEGESAINKTTGSDFPNDTPSSGHVFVVATDEQEEHMYRYASWSGEVLTLATAVAGTADAATTGQTLVDESQNFSSLGIQVGDIIHRDSGSNEWAYVLAISTTTNPNDTLTTTVLSDGTDWANLDTYDINTLVQNYGTDDTFFIPYLDTEDATGTDGSPGTVSSSGLVYSGSDKNVVVVVRNSEDSLYYIQPFEAANTITESGLSQATIRSEDTVYS